MWTVVTPTPNMSVGDSVRLARGYPGRGFSVLAGESSPEFTPGRV